MCKSEIKTQYNWQKYVLAYIFSWEKKFFSTFYVCEYLSKKLNECIIHYLSKILTFLIFSFLFLETLIFKGFLKIFFNWKVKNKAQLQAWLPLLCGLNYSSVTGSQGSIPWVTVWVKVTFMLVREDADPRPLV